VTASPAGRSRGVIVAVLVLISMVGPLSLNIAMPVLPLIQTSFGATRENATLVLSLFLAGMAVAQLLLGPLADRFGRRPVLIGGLAVYVAASFAAIFAEAIGQLLAARVLQSLGATVGLPLARTIIRDLYDRDSAASMIGWVTMGMVVAPMFSPILGAFAAQSYGWQAIFYVCTFIGVTTFLVVVFALPETRPASLDAATTRDVWRRSVALLGERRFIGFAGTTACASAMFFAFQAGAPFLVIGVFGVSETVYAAWFLLGGMSYMAGNGVAGRFSRRVGVDGMIRIGNAVALVGGLLALALALVPVQHPAAMFVPLMFIAAGNGLVIPNAVAGAVSVDVKAAGAASGLAGFCQSGLSTLVSFAVGSIVATTALPIGLAMTLIALAAIGFAALAR
jgi:DHA1 family bicyclomycin/chloramphenicol resistance-like MFS transporter